MNVWKERQETFDLQQLHCYSRLKNTDWIENSVGTLICGACLPAGSNPFFHEEVRMMEWSGQCSFTKAVKERTQSLSSWYMRFHWKDRLRTPSISRKIYVFLSCSIRFPLQSGIRIAPRVPRNMNIRKPTMNRKAPQPAFSLMLLIMLHGERGMSPSALTDFVLPSGKTISRTG